MKVSGIERGSIAQKLEIEIGEELLSINGKPVRDCLDLLFLQEQKHILLHTRLEDGTVQEYEIDKPEWQPLGLETDSDGFGHKICCNNRCVFCFVDQMPKGMRKTLYVKDDDWRTSFLMGSYVTLTNLSEEEIARIIEQRIAPLYVSVHATDAAVSAKMLCSRAAVNPFDIIRRFAEAGIKMHAQIVLCEGLNDGAVLERSLTDLAGLYPQICSVAVVPVGLTKHREGLTPIAPVSRACARQALQCIHAFADKMLEQTGTRFVFGADELYLRAEEALPTFEEYESFDQIENGVGLLAKFEDELLCALESARKPRYQRVLIATGVDAAPFLRRWMRKVEETVGCEIEVYAIRNDFFGETVTVAGLLTARDIIAQLKGNVQGDVMLLSAACFREGEDVMLDDVSIQALSEALGMPCKKIACDGFDLMEELTEE